MLKRFLKFGATVINFKGLIDGTIDNPTLSRGIFVECKFMDFIKNMNNKCSMYGVIRSNNFEINLVMLNANDTLGISKKDLSLYGDVYVINDVDSINDMYKNPPERMEKFKSFKIFNWKIVNITLNRENKMIHHYYITRNYISKDEYK